MEFASTGKRELNNKSQIIWSQKLTMYLNKLRLVTQEYFNILVYVSLY